MLLRIEAALSQDRSSSSIPQARRRLHGVPALVAEQKNRYQLLVPERANADVNMRQQLHADD